MYIVSSFDAFVSRVGTGYKELVSFLPLLGATVPKSHNLVMSVALVRGYIVDASLVDRCCSRSYVRDVQS